MYKCLGWLHVYGLRPWMVRSTKHRLTPWDKLYLIQKHTASLYSRKLSQLATKSWNLRKISPSKASAMLVFLLLTGDSGKFLRLVVNCVTMASLWAGVSIWAGGGGHPGIHPQLFLHTQILTVGPQTQERTWGKSALPQQCWQRVQWSA